MSGGGPNEDFITLFVYWLCTYLSGILAAKTRLSPLLFYLVFGSILGNLKIVHTSHALHFFSELAITLVFLALGFEESVHHFIGGVKKAWGIASIGAGVPFLCGLLWAYMFFPNQGMMAMLMCGLAVTATAVSLTMISLKTEGLAVSKPAIGIMTSAVLDDVMCLALVAIMIPIATGAADPTVLGIGWVVAKSIIFFTIIAFLHIFIFAEVRKPGDAEKHWILAKLPGIRSVGIHRLIRFKDGEHAVVATLMIGLGIGLLASVFDFHPAIGAYMAGLILEENYYDIDGAALADNGAGDTAPANCYYAVKDLLESAAFSWIGPVFFLNLGANITIEAELLPKTILPALALYGLLLVGQTLSAAIAARYVPGGFTWAEAWLIGFGMLGRAELFFVVINICHLENSIFGKEVFFSMTLAAMLLNVTVPIAISCYKPYYMRAKSNEGKGSSRMKRMSTLDLLKSTKGVSWLHKKAYGMENSAARRAYQGVATKPSETSSEVQKANDTSLVSVENVDTEEPTIEIEI